MAAVSWLRSRGEYPEARQRLFCIVQDSRVPRRRLRVCQFTPSLWNGGAEERMARILGALDRSRFDLAWTGFGPAREALIARAGDEVYIEPIARDHLSGIEFALVPRIARTLRRLAPDVLHIHNWSTSAYGIAAARLAGISNIAYETAGRESPDPPTPQRQRVMRTMAPHIRRFTTVCKFLGDELEAHWGAPADAIRVMPTGVDLARFAADKDAKAAARQRLGIPHDAIVVGSLSVLRPVKRLTDLVEAVGRLARDRSNLYLVVAGQPVQLDVADLAALGRAVGLGWHLVLPGMVSVPAEILAAYDVFVSCSIFEGASNAIIEAMAASLPVVGTRVGGTPELITDGDNGFLVEPLDITGLAQAIGRLVDDPELRAEMGAAGRARAEAYHDDRHMVDVYASLYEELASTPPGTRDMLASFAKSARALRI